MNNLSFSQWQNAHMYILLLCNQVYLFIKFIRDKKLLSLKKGTGKILRTFTTT